MEAVTAIASQILPMVLPLVVPIIKKMLASGGLTPLEEASIALLDAIVALLGAQA